MQKVSAEESSSVWPAFILVRLFGQVKSLEIQ